MKRLITYLTCATMVVAGGYAFSKVARQELPNAKGTAQMLQLKKAENRVASSEMKNEKQSQTYGKTDVTVTSNRKVLKVADPRLKPSMMSLRQKMQRSDLKMLNARPLADPIPVAAPFVCDFETEESFNDNWTVIDSNGDGTTWGFDNETVGMGVAMVMYNSEMSTDDYLVTINPVTLDAGAAYVDLSFGGLSSSYYEGLEVMYGTSPEVSEMTTIFSETDFMGGYIYSSQIEFNVAEAGNYYFAIHGCSEADQYGVFVDNIEINSGEYIGVADIGIVGVTLPEPSPELTASEPISVTVGNYGTADIVSYSLSWSAVCNGEEQTGEVQVVNEVLPVGEAMTIDLDSRVDMSAEGVYNVTVNVSDVVPADGQREEEVFDNNSGSASTTHFGVTDVPFVSDFSQGLQPEKWNSDGSWVYDDSYGAVACNGTGAFISQGVNLESGKTYRISYNYMAGYSFMGMFTIPENWKLSCGLAGEAMNVIMEVTEDYTGDVFIDDETTFICEESGVYQFAFSQDAPAGAFYVASVSITEIAGYDMQIAGVYGYPTKIPASQCATVSATVVIDNNANTCGGTLTASMGNATIATIDIPEIAAGDSEFIPVEFSLANVEVGTTAEIEFSVALDGQADSNEDNNVGSISIDVTEDEFAYDHMAEDMYNENSIIGVGGGSFVAGIPIHLSADDVLTGISVGWGAADGQTIQLSVYKYDPSGAIEENDIVYYPLGDEILSTSVPQGTDVGQIEYAISPRALEAGDYMVCVGCTGYCIVADLVAPGSLYLVNEGLAIDQSSTGLGTIAIRALFGEGTPTAHDLTVNGITSPNGSGVFASNQSIVVSVTNNGAEAATGSLGVTVNGEALESQEVSLAAYASATYTFVADMSAPGSYTIVATATLAGDENPDDNSVEKTVECIDASDPYFMNFEGCADFAVEGFNPAWISVDGDKAEVYGFQGITFPMPEDYTCGFMAFNPYATTPSLVELAPNAAPYSGEKFGAVFASTSLLNDDWLISPLLQMPDSEAGLTMQVQTYMADYGLEKYEVCVSTTDNSPESFTVVYSGEAPAGVWSEVDVDLSEYNGQQIYVAIHCISEDTFIFMVDDISVTKPASGIDDVALGKAALQLYPNPASEVLVISSAGQDIQGVQIYSASGTMVGTVAGTGNEVRYDVSGLATGVYFAKVATDGGTQVLRFMVK